MALACAPAPCYSAAIDTRLWKTAMNKMTFESLNTLLDDIFRATVQAARSLLRAIGAMAWPQLFATAVVLTLLPLAFTLFVAFMLVKLVVAAIVVQSRRHKHDGQD